MIVLVDIVAKGVVHVSKEQSLSEKRDGRILQHEVRQHFRRGIDDVVNCVNHTVLHRVVTMYDKCRAVDVVIDWYRFCL